MATDTKTRKSNQPKAAKKQSGAYLEAVGRRKSAIARVRLFEATKNEVTVNNREFERYFSMANHRALILAPLNEGETPVHYKISARVAGGGTNAQAEAVRHGIARALLLQFPEKKKDLKKLGFLKRDSREKERKHFGFRKARKRKQWKKR